MTSRAQMSLVRGRIHSENLTFQLCCVNKCKTKKERQTTKQKKTAEKIAEATRSIKTSQKTVIAAEAITFCIKPFPQYFPRSDLKFGEIETAVTKRNKMPQNFLLWKAFVKVEIPK